MAEVMAREVPRLRRLSGGIEATDTATCYHCADGLATPVPDGWACQQCGSYTPYDEDTP